MYDKSNESELITRNEGVDVSSVLFFSPFIVTGLILFYLSFKLFVFSVNSSFWIPTEAIVEQITLEKTVSRGPKGGSYISKEVIIQYQYNFEEKDYKSSKIGYGYEKGKSEEQDSLYNLLKQSHQFIAYVNPKKPSESVVIKSGTKNLSSIIIFSLITNFFNLLLLLFHFRKRDKARKKVLFITCIYLIMSIFMILRNDWIPLQERITVIEYAKK